MNAIAEFTAAMQRAGLNPGQVIGDGCLHRCAASDDKGRKQSGWYVLHLDGIAAGVFGDWRTGQQHTWAAKENKAALSPEEVRKLDQAVKAAQCQREEERAQTRKAAQRKAAMLWRQGKPASPAHPYLCRKQVQAHGLRQYQGILLVPMRDEHGELWNVQTIDSERTKRFQRGAATRGLYLPIGKPADGVLCIAEGYATAASIYEATGYATACAFNCGNLHAVALAMRRKFPTARIVLCADNDAATAQKIGKNPGIEAATRAAQAVGGYVVTPETISPANTGQGMPNEHPRKFNQPPAA